MDGRPDFAIRNGQWSRTGTTLVVAASPLTEVMLADLDPPSTADVRVAGSLAEGVDLASEDVGLVILSLELPDSEGAGTFYTLSDEMPVHPILVVSRLPRDPVGHALIRAGAMEYVEASTLGRGVLATAADVSVTRWARRRQLADLTADAGILSARVAGAQPLLDHAVARLTSLAGTMRNSDEGRYHDVADVVSDAAMALLDGPDRQTSVQLFSEWLDRLVAVVSVPTGPEIDVRAELVEVPEGLAHHVRAATQEMLMNAVRHAEANRIAVEVSTRSTNVRICVIDDGVGFTSTSVCGDGLINLERRATQFGGDFRHRREGGRTIVEWWIPTTMEDTG